MSTNQNDESTDSTSDFDGDVPTTLVRYQGNGPYVGADGVAVSETDPFYDAEDEAEANALVESGRFTFVEDEEREAARAALRSAGSPATAAVTEPFASQEVQTGTTESQQMRAGEGPENQPTGSNPVTSEALTPGSSTTADAEAKAASTDGDDFEFDGGPAKAYPFIGGNLSDLEAALDTHDYDDELDRLEAAERRAKGRAGAFTRIDAHREQIDAEKDADSGGDSDSDDED